MAMNNKGSMLDWFLIIVVIILAACVLFASKMVVDKVDDTGVFADYSDAQNIIDTSNNTLLNMDTMMLFIIIGLSLFVLLSSALVYNHPAFFIIGIILLFIAITVAGVFSNAFWMFTDSSAIADTAALYPKTTFLINNLPIYLLLLGLCTATVMYISWRRT